MWTWRSDIERRISIRTTTRSRRFGRNIWGASQLFVQLLRLCQRAGLVKLGHVALDGTKIKAYASKGKAMSYGRMEEAEKKLEDEVKALLAEAARVDVKEDGKYGKGKLGDELPQEWARRESRLAKIREAKAALEQGAREDAKQKQAEVEVRLQEREKQEQERARKLGGRPPQAPDPEQAKPEPTAQRNFTDSDSRIMKDGATKEFVQAHNAQAAVDGEAQVIVAASVPRAEDCHGASRGIYLKCSGDQDENAGQCVFVARPGSVPYLCIGRRLGRRQAALPAGRTAQPSGRRIQSSNPRWRHAAG